MADRSMDFTGNNDWAQMGKVIDPADHPATNMPDATDHHDGTVLGTDTLRRAMNVDKETGGAGQKNAMGAAENIDYIVKGR